MATRATEPLRTGREDSTDRMLRSSALSAFLVLASNDLRWDDMRLRRTMVATWRMASFCSLVQEDEEESDVLAVSNDRNHKICKSRATRLPTT